MSKKIDIIFVVLAATFWGTAGIYVRILSALNITEMQVVLGRSVFTFIVLGIMILFTDKGLFKVKIRDLWLFAGSGILSIGLFNYCYYKTMSLTSLSVAAVLLYTAPFFAVIMSAFIFREKITFKIALSCVLAFFGCALVSGFFSNSSTVPIKAVIYGIITGFGYSLYTIFSRLLLKRGYNSLTINFYTFLFCAFGCLFLQNPTNTFGLIFSSSKATITMLMMALFNTVVPYMLYNFGLMRVDGSKALIIATLEPVVATAIGCIIYKEAITFSGIIGVILVFVSVVILNVKVGKSVGKDIFKSKRKG